MLHSPEHVLGRNVKEASCQFESPNVSGKHCIIFRRVIGFDGRTIPLSHIPGPNDRVVTFIKDSRYEDIESLFVVVDVCTLFRVQISI